MTGLARPCAALLVAALVALTTSGCGSASSGSRGGGPGTVAPATAAVQDTVSMLESSAPDSLDPQVGESSESTEATWVAYTGLVSYAHHDGATGATLIPGLATTLPRVSDGGRTYTLTLRSGLRFSNGAPVTASDFVFTLKRAVIMSEASLQLTGSIQGARAFARTFSRLHTGSISGVSADDASGRIVIHLRAPDPDFDSVLAEPSLGLIPAGSELLDGPPGLPPGCGPYVIEHVVVDRFGEIVRYELVRNPRWHALPGIPDGKVDIDVRVSSDLAADVDAVLNNSDDLLDDVPGVPADLISEVQSDASARFAFVPTGAVTDYIFLNQFRRPFSSRLARTAVVLALDHSRIDKLADGELAPGCFLAPPVWAGHPRGAACPLQALSSTNLTLARQDVHLAGVLGESVVVYSPAEQPIRSVMGYYVHVLDQLGFHAQLVVLPSRKYAFGVGLQGSLDPQSGFATLGQALPGSDEDPLPDPLQQYAQALDSNDISVEANTNLGAVDDPHLDQQITQLQHATTLAQQSTEWQQVDEYVADRADVAVLGYQKPAFLASARMDYGALEINPIYGWDFTSLQLLR